VWIDRGRGEEEAEEEECGRGGQERGGGGSPRSDQRCRMRRESRIRRGDERERWPARVPLQRNEPHHRFSHAARTCDAPSFGTFGCMRALLTRSTLIYRAGSGYRRPWATPMGHRLGGGPSAHLFSLYIVQYTLLLKRKIRERPKAQPEGKNERRKRPVHARTDGSHETTPRFSIGGSAKASIT
jgi:hypothetical protein